jgi:RHS repeat-associated protein
VLLASDRSQSVIAEVADSTINNIAYSAYGERSAQQEVATQLGFNGQLREARIGWYMLGNGYRAYNPRLMRFHSPDSWSPFGRGGLNLYMYCAGEPVMNSDPTGHIRQPMPWTGKFTKLRGELYWPNRAPNPIHNNPVTIEQAASAMRSLQKDLSPRTPNKGGLLDALGSLAENIEKNRRVYPPKSAVRARNPKEKTASRNQQNTPTSQPWAAPFRRPPLRRSRQQTRRLTALADRPAPALALPIATAQALPALALTAPSAASVLFPAGSLVSGIAVVTEALSLGPLVFSGVSTLFVNKNGLSTSPLSQHPHT